MNKTYREMMDQPAALRQTHDLIASRADELHALICAFRPKRFVAIGCGSGYCLCHSAALSLSKNTGLPALALPAGDLMLHAEEYAPWLEHSILIAPTRSGSTSELLLAIEAARRVSDVKVVVISAVANSKASQAADLCFDIPWAFDASVCQTRTVSNLYCASLHISAIWGGQGGLIEELHAMIGALAGFMDANESPLSGLAKGDWDNAIVLADGEMSGLAAEGSMAFTEIAQLHAHHYHILDVRHGPMVLVDGRTLVVCALRPEGLDQQLKVLADCKERGATVVALTDARYANRCDHADLVLCFPKTLSNAVAGIPMITAIQQLSVAKAQVLGLNADEPEGLVAFVQL